MDPTHGLVVHALLICRKAQAGPTGELNLEDVLQLVQRAVADR